ncbi:outer membrane protein assembly factor BamB family protein [Nocardia caishijiensis]|uniref:Pyrroloquinoline-quinone binding quinoprotein n=1 Tax=Nocardia caishijiensis TaxID=184756 RepID=A0ABQ6YGD7_9NOCA|nr:PQQ-binding-like beta-propeller repeat protein [Nocardia caishijiensis]KAF0844843.1 putative pyrroloquinoline-quinone binding quinoprotein [Nocardia caishijiensis]
MTTPGLRGLILAAVAALVTGAGAVVVLSQPVDTTRKITGTNDAAPGLAWSVHAAELSGTPEATFRSPVYGTELDSGSTGFVGTDDIVTTVVRTDDDAALFGIDAHTGATRWRAPAAGLGGCGEVPVDGKLVCFSAADPEGAAVVGYDLATGEYTRTSIEWYPFAIATDADRVYLVEGNAEDDDVRVRAGSLAHPDRFWTTPFALGGPWEDVLLDIIIDVSHGQGVLALSGDLVGFALDTGAPTWTATRCNASSALVGALIRRDSCPIGADLLDRQGRTLATTDTAEHTVLDHPTDDTIPVVLGDRGHDRRTGAALWTSPDLGDRSDSAVVVVLGEMILLADPASETVTALDSHTGARRWRRPLLTPVGTVATSTDPIVLTHHDGLLSLDPATGETRWDIPFRAVDADPYALVADGTPVAQGDGRFVYVSDRTAIGLRPLP